MPSNGLVAVTDAGLLLVDTAWSEEQTDAILRWGTERFARPWIGAVITHDHADRDGGLNALFGHGIPVAALDLTVDKLAQRGVHGVSTLFEARVGERIDVRGFSAFYRGPGHTSDNIVVAFPGASVLFGGCLIESAAAKDLGFTGDADLQAWPTSVRRVAEKYHDRRWVVPGHGPVDFGDAPIRNTLKLLKSAKK
jgi:metallo-beta-lactamase class B